MSDSRGAGSGNGPDRNTLHDRICGDDTDPGRGKLSNKDKVTFICELIDYPEKAFDLELPFPIEDWIMTDDNSLMSAGAFLNELRERFYREAPVHDAWRKHAEAEYWLNEFQRMIEQRTTGKISRKPRKHLH